MTREFDLVLLGATGFTGKLVAHYLREHDQTMAWALAGRNRDKLAAVAAGLGRDVPVIVTDTLDRAACDALAARTRVVCTTVGPYSKYGSEVVAACAAAGTHYCDLTGEIHWMRRMIDAHHETAKRTGARIVHTCGFDSIPSDLGTWATQQEFIARYGRPAARVTAIFGETSGGFSGGTAASAFAIADAMKDPEVRRVLRNPYGLDPDPTAPRPPAPDERAIGWDRALGMFTMPFVMAATNSRVVRRGHALAGFPWGEDFVYREVMSTPGNAKGLALAVGLTAGLAGLAAMMARPRLRAMLERRAPKSGQGPDEETRRRGHWIVRFVAEHGDQRLVYTVADPAGDPGYASTSKMLGESALCLAFDRLSSEGGVQTPSVAMDGALVDRLRAAGLTFSA
jgi:short subunit dehydrogenase-like uncharacterized protein